MRVEQFELLRYWVQSKTNPQRKYLVDLLSNECNCIGFQKGLDAQEKRTGTCQHIRRAQRFFAVQVLDQIRSKMKQYDGP